MFRHGLRVSEACGLKLDYLDTESRVLHVARLKRAPHSFAQKLFSGIRIAGDVRVDYLKSQAKASPSIY